MDADANRWREAVVTSMLGERSLDRDGAREAAAGSWKATKKPSPAWSTSSPRCSRKRVRSVRSCHSTRSSQAVSPIASTRFVDPQMSLKTNVPNGLGALAAQQLNGAPRPVDGSETREDREGRVQLDGGRFVLAGCLVGLSEQSSRACRLVGSVERMPAPHSLPQRRDCRDRVPVRESDQPSSPAGCRGQRVRAIDRRESL